MLIQGLTSLVLNSAAMQAVLGTPATRTDKAGGYWANIALTEPSFPYIVYQQLSRNVVLSFQGVNAFQEARFRFSCYGGAYLQAKRCAQALKQLLDGFTGQLPDTTVVGNTIPITEMDELVDLLHGTVYGVHLDYYIWFTDNGS